MLVICTTQNHTYINHSSCILCELKMAPLSSGTRCLCTKLQALTMIYVDDVFSVHCNCDPLQASNEDRFAHAPADTKTNCHITLNVIRKQQYFEVLINPLQPAIPYINQYYMNLLHVINCETTSVENSRLLLSAFNLPFVQSIID